MIAIIGTSDRPCWLAEACKILLLLLLHASCLTSLLCAVLVDVGRRTVKAQRQFGGQHLLHD